MEACCASHAGSPGSGNGGWETGRLLPLNERLRVRRVLAGHPLFNRLPARCRQFLPSCATIEEFAGGTMLLRAGLRARRFYLALEDGLPVEWTCSQTGNGGIFTVARNALVGISWCFPPHRWQCSLRLLRSAALVVLDARRLSKLMGYDPDQCPELNLFVLHRFLHRLHHDPAPCPECC
ncbi:MAG: hypothetical protein AUK55_09635 [Syntrophobacteraceae bacterium CG2_30_61_12]|nr:MAG: hypothetical protein AUK55_09635 [Syntrophobacteraceae bacterium CG2_30_61_12]PIU31206.1 MAG: hypothetical protein COT06_09400 [Syntrophobacteraceae bacterium CG07_land_8_20_14_0_80_61_8]